MTCPKCNGTMAERSVGRVRVQQCESCQGVFLDRAELANLVEAENDPACRAQRRATSGSWNRGMGG